MREPRAHARKGIRLFMCHALNDDGEDRPTMVAGTVTLYYLYGKFFLFIFFCVCVGGGLQCTKEHLPTLVLFHWGTSL